MAANTDVDEAFGGVQPHQYDNTNNSPYETAWNNFNISLKWNPQSNPLDVDSSIIGHPCKFQYAFSYEQEKIKETFMKENVKINTDFQYPKCLSIDVTAENCVSPHDAAEMTNTLFTKLFSDYKVMTLSNRNKKCHKLTSALMKSHQCVNVVCFLDKTTKFMHYVGYEEFVDKFLREQSIEMIQTRVFIDADKWKRLSPAQRIKEEASVDIEMKEEGVSISGERDEVIIAQQMIIGMEADLSVDDVVFDKTEHNQLLIVNDEGNEIVHEFFKKILQDCKLEVFSEMSVENQMTVVRIYAKSEEVVKAACVVIKKSIVELDLDHNEAECVQEHLDKWTERNKLKSMKTRTMQNIVCTSDAAGEICQTVCDIVVPLPNLLSDFLTSFGEEVFMNLKSNNDLDDVKFCPSQQIVKLHGCLDKVKDFRKQLLHVCMFITQLKDFVKQEQLVMGIVNLHECKIDVEMLSENASRSFSNCTLEAEWHLHGYVTNTTKVSLIVGDINNVDLKGNTCKLQFMNKKFISLQEKPMKQYEYLYQERFVYKQKQIPAKSVVWTNIKALHVMSADEWMVEIVVSKVWQLSQTLSDVFREAASRKCLHVVIPLELKSSPWKPWQIACACMKVLAGIQFPFEVIFLCHQMKSVVEVVKHAEIFFKKNDILLCIREFLCPDLIPSPVLSSTVVTVQPDLITAVEVDVIVSAVSQDLNLSLGYTSNLILRCAGKGIQEECHLKYKNGIHFGEIAVTTAGNMQHIQLILHCALHKFEKHSAANRVKSMVKKCLIEADRRQYRSIAFPALGTGKLGYPPRETAHAMFEAIDEYKKQALNSCLEKVVICAPDFSNDDISKVFNNEQSRRQKSLLRTVGNGIDNCGRLSCCLGNGIKAVHLNIIAVEDIKMLPAYFVIVNLTENLQYSRGKMDLCLDGNKSHDCCQVLLSDDIYHDIKEAIKNLCFKRVYDIAIDISGLENLDGFFDKLTVLLESLMKETNMQYLQNIVVLVHDKDMRMLPAQLCDSGFISSSFRYFRSRSPWLQPTIPYKKVQFTIIGKSASEVKRKLIVLLDTDVNDFEVIGGTDVDNAGTNVDNAGTNVDNAGTNVDNAGTDVDNEGTDVDTEGTDVDTVMENKNSEQSQNDHLSSQQVEKITNGISQAREIPEDMMTAEINPGIVQLLKTSAKFVHWHDDKDMMFECEGNSVFIRGPFEKVLLFEKFLEDQIIDLDQKDKNDDTSEGNDSDAESNSKIHLNNLDEDVVDSNEDSFQNSRDEPYTDEKHKTHYVKAIIKETDDVHSQTSYSISPTDGQGNSRASSSFGRQSPGDYQIEIKSTQPEIVGIDTVDPISIFKFKRLEVRMVCGDMPKLKVDCLISSANKHLKESFGVSKALSLAGGESYWKAVEKAKVEYGELSAGSCINTEPGCLPCKHVIHAVGPKSSSSQVIQELLQILQDTVKGCLEMADGLKIASVALPIIGCGAGNISEMDCALQYYHALDAFSQHCGSLKYVYIVEINAERLENMAATFKNECLRNKETELVNNEQEFVAYGQYSARLILLGTFCLTRIGADAIICIEDIAADGGLVPNMLLKEGGEKYVEQNSALKQKYVKEKIINQVIEMKCSKLQYKYVLFSSISKYSNSEVKTSIHSIVKEAIVKANDLGCQSVYIPIVGENERGINITNDSMCDAVVEGLKLYLSGADQSSKLEIKIVCQTEAMYQYMKSVLINSKVFILNSAV